MSEPVLQRLKVSREGMVLIQSFEGFRPRALQRDDGRWVIGYGHTRSAREGGTVNEADAELLLQYDLLAVTDAVNDGVTRPINQHQFDALASFAFSVGLDRFRASDVLQRLNAGAAAEAADAMVGWPEPVLPETPLRRRVAERALFVADPDASVTLSDLLAAPLPAPQIVAPPAIDAVTQARAAAVASLLGEVLDPVADAAPPVVGGPDANDDPTDVAPTSSAPPSTTASDEPAAPPEAENPAIPPSNEAAALAAAADAQRYAPYAAPIVGALPEPVIAAPVTDAGSPPVPIEPPSDVPIIGESSLVLTPQAEDAVPAARPAWPPEDRPVPSLGETPLFDGQPEQYQALGPVLRHESRGEPPARFDWGETGAFLIMGAVGLVSFGMSMAALRLASQQSAGSDETAMIGWVLAIIGASCVGVSSINLYRRWGRVDED